MSPRPAEGSRLGPYDLIARIGKGGMGEVWKARDTRLDREVAVKVSAEQFSDRFEREARAIAALNHPNICTLFDVGPNYLVIELIDGHTLADRIAEGPIPIEEALAIAKQIADALEAAHEKNIVHRDLKPANIKVRADGSVKVLDFGLAKAGLPGAEVSHDSPTLVHSPTLVGVILGTAAYMAPEQARGKVVDKRADIWSFGVVLHEMLTGKRAFEGEDLTETLASVVMKEPDLQPVPHKVRRLIGACLQKDPKKRLRDIGDVWRLLDDAPQSAAVVAKRSWLWPAIAAVALAAITGAVVWWLTKPAPQTPRVVGRFSIPLPEGQNFTRTGRHLIAISPDGKRFAYVANRQLYLRNMNELEARPVPGTNEDPAEPVFSPDGQWLAYFTPANGLGASPWVLQKVAIAGGAAVTLAQLPVIPSGAAWSDGEIAFGINSGGVSAIEAAPETGGPLRIIAKADATKERVRQPRLLPDGKHVMFEARPINATTEGQIVIQGLDDKDRRVLVNTGSDPHMLSSGQLVYIHDGTLLAVPFDSRQLAVTGGPVPVLEGVSETSTTGTGHFAVSSDGTLVFVPGAADALASPKLLVWVDREGHEQPIPARPRAYEDARISPDGRKIAVLSNDEEHDLWVFDLEKETLTRLTFGPAYESDELWSADGKSLFFRTGTQAPVAGSYSDIHRKAADGTGTEEALTQNGQGGYPLSLAPDGKSLVYLNTTAGGLFVLPLDPKGAPHPLLGGAPGRAGYANISPDGRWIAYTSSESGRREIYVGPFPAGDSGRWQISSEGASLPVWSRSGRELFFLTADNHIAVVAVQPGASFAYGKPQALFDASRYDVHFSPAFDVSPDGKRFLMVKAVSQVGDTTERPSIVVVPNWTEEVTARLAGGR